MTSAIIKIVENNALNSSKKFKASNNAVPPFKGLVYVSLTSIVYYCVYLHVYIFFTKRPIYSTKNTEIVKKLIIIAC